MATRQQTRKPAQQAEAEHYNSIITDLGDPFEAGEYTGLEITFEDGTTGTNWTKDPDKYHDPIFQAYEDGTEVEYSAEQGQKGLKIRVYFPQEEQQQQKPQRKSAAKTAAPRARVSAKEEEEVTPKKRASGVQYVSSKDAYWENKFEWEKERGEATDFAIQCQEWGKILGPLFVQAYINQELSLEKAINGLHKAVTHAQSVHKLED